MHRLAGSAVAAAVALAATWSAADIYSYVDRDGTMHFTNAPGGDGRYRLYMRSKDTARRRVGAGAAAGAGRQSARGVGGNQIGPRLLVAARARVGVGAVALRLIEGDDQEPPVSERGRAKDPGHVLLKPHVRRLEATRLAADARRVVAVVAEVRRDEGVVGGRLLRTQVRAQVRVSDVVRGAGR
jgi:hypothetical protein